MEVFMRVLTIAMGVILTLAGIWCLVNLGKTYAALAFVLGIVMLVSGISNIITYISQHRSSHVTGWVLADGILTTILGIIVLLNPFTADVMISIFFGMWLMMSGVLRIVGAFEVRKIRIASGDKTWLWMMILGVLTLLVGLYGFVHPVIAGVALAMMLAIFFIMQGINSIALGISMSGNGKN